MNLHVLFAPEVVDPSGPSPSPISAMRALTLDDEVQYRCAGFVQAEIERFAEELAENDQGDDQGQGADEDEDDESQHSGSEEDEPAPSKKKKGTKAKKGKKGAKEREISKFLVVVLQDHELTLLRRRLTFQKPLLPPELSSNVNMRSSASCPPSSRLSGLAQFTCVIALSF